jgi:hypothetical protein
MAIAVDKGPVLKEAFPWLRDIDACCEMILDATERNSVIEGVPPFTAESRRQLKDELLALISRPAEPAE